MIPGIVISGTNTVLVLDETDIDQFPYNESFFEGEGFNFATGMGMPILRESAVITQAEAILGVYPVYGHIFLLIIHKTDDDYALIRMDKGDVYKYTEVFTTSANIFSITIVRPGHVIFSTGNGYYESFDTGMSIANVNSTNKDHKKICYLGQGNTIIAHDGVSKIDYSNDVARSFVTQLDVGSLPTESIMPALDGAYSRSLAGFGEYIYECTDIVSGIWTQKFKLETGERVIQIECISENEFFIKTFINYEPTFHIPLYRTYLYNSPWSKLILQYYQEYDENAPYIAMTSSSVNTPEGSVVSLVADISTQNAQYLYNTGTGTDFGTTNPITGSTKVEMTKL